MDARFCMLHAIFKKVSSTFEAEYVTLFPSITTFLVLLAQSSSLDLSDRTNELLANLTEIYVRIGVVDGL